MLIPTTVILNIEYMCIRAIVVRSRKILHCASAPLKPGLVKDGAIAEIEELGRAIDSFFAKKGIPKDRVEVSIAGLRPVTRVLTLPRLKQSLVEEAIRNEAAREMPIPSNELYLSWQRMRSDNPTEMRYFVVGAQKSLTNDYLTALRYARIHPFSICPKPLALARAVDRSSSIVIDIEETTFDVIVVVDGIPVIVRSLAFSDDSLTLSDNMHQILSELSRVVDFYNSSRPDQVLDAQTPILLTGQQGNNIEIREAIKTQIGNPMNSPRLPLSCPPMMPIHEYATSFGLAWKPSLSSRLTRAKEIDVSTAGINVLPADLRPHQVSTKEVLHPLAAAVCAALLLSSYLSLSVGYAEAGKVNTQLDHVNLQIQRVREQTASIKKVELEAEQLRKDFDALRTNAGFSAKLESLVQSVQPGMQLTTVSQVEGSITLSGTALTQDDIIAYVLRLQEQGSLSNPAISITASTSSGGPMMFKLLYSS